MIVSTKSHDIIHFVALHAAWDVDNPLSLVCQKYMGAIYGHLVHIFSNHWNNYEKGTGKANKWYNAKVCENA